MYEFSMHKTNQSINIQAPPVQELHKQRSCLKRSCTSGCGCIVFFFITVLVLLNILSGSGSHEVTEIPEETPIDLTIYEAEAINKIEISDHSPRGTIADITAYIPKVFLTSLYITLGDNAPESIRQYYDQANNTEKTGLSRFFHLLAQPIRRQYTQIEFTWDHLNAEPKFIQEFYTTTLSQSSYDMSLSEQTTATKRHLLFEKEGTIGTITIRDNTPEKKGTDTVIMTLSIPIDS